MNKFWLVILISLLLIANSDSGRAQGSREPVFKLDHFKAYTIVYVKAKPPKEVTLNDQFLVKPFKIKPELIKHIILPVSKKNHEKTYGIMNNLNHLAWYPLKKDTARITFLFSNQFTDFKFTKMVVRNLRAILVPTEKIIKGSKAPRGLDHYLCYQRDGGERTTKQVILGDQFQEGVMVKAIGPEYFCNPCSKDGQVINNKEDHLAVYVLDEGKPVKKPVSIKNQFGDQAFEVKDQVFLLVPSKKKYRHK